VANTVAAAVRNRMFPPEDDADGAETVLETGRSSAKFGTRRHSSPTHATDATEVCWPDGYADKRGQVMWDRVMDLL
jgi:hypothetical protein